MSKVKTPSVTEPKANAKQPTPYKGQPRSENGQFAEKKQVAGLGLPINATRKIDGRAIRKVRG